MPDVPTSRALRRAPLLPEGEGTLLSGAQADPRHLLPHRPPMLLLDAVTAIDPAGRRLRAQRRVDPEDPVFRGHFPGLPLYPGVLQVEMMAQAALALLPFLEDRPAPRLARFTRIRDAAFLAPVQPGDVLQIHAAAEDDGLILTAQGQVWRGEVLCAWSISEAMLDA